MLSSKTVIPSHRLKGVEIGKSFTGKPQLFMNHGGGVFWQTLSALDNDERFIQRLMTKKAKTK